MKATDLLEQQHRNVLLQGYEAALPDNYEETSADIALAEEENSAA
jgi:hypothetical protein